MDAKPASHSSSADATANTTKPLPQLPVEIQFQVLGFNIDHAYETLASGPLEATRPYDFNNVQLRSKVQYPSSRSLTYAAGSEDDNREPVTLKTLLGFPNIAAFHHTILAYASLSHGFAEEVYKILQQQRDIASDAYLAVARTTLTLQSQATDTFRQMMHAGPFTYAQARTKFREANCTCDKAFQDAEKAGVALFVVESCLEWVEALLRGGRVDKGRGWSYGPCVAEVKPKGQVQRPKIEAKSSRLALVPRADFGKGGFSKWRFETDLRHR